MIIITIMNLILIIFGDIVMIEPDKLWLIISNHPFLFLLMVVLQIAFVDLLCILSMKYKKDLPSPIHALYVLGSMIIPSFIISFLL